MLVDLPTMKERIARKLGVLAVSDRLSAEDGSLIGEKCLALQRQLASLDIATIDFSDGIDDLYADIIADMAAALLVDDFMLSDPKRSKIKIEGDLGLPIASVAERRLRKVLAPMVVSAPVRADYY
jgi:hypothetical protein